MIDRNGKTQTDQLAPLFASLEYKAADAIGKFTMTVLASYEIYLMETENEAHQAQTKESKP